METERGHDRKFLVCLFEFLGQIFFMYAATVSGASGSDTWGIAGPLALFAIINIFGSVSGGHFNPAVTLGVFVREARWVENFIFCILIIASQISGALVGMLLSYVVLRVQENGEWVLKPEQVPLMVPSTITREMIKNANDGTGSIDYGEYWTTFYMEVICTFIFVLFILHVTGKRTMGPDLGVYGVPAICLVLWALCNVDSFTGASFNPALATAQFVMQVAWYPYNPEGVLTHYMWQYIVGAALGGILAGVFYHQHEKLFAGHCEEVYHDEDSHHNKSSHKMHDHEAEMHGKGQ